MGDPDSDFRRCERVRAGRSAAREAAGATRRWRTRVVGVGLVWATLALGPGMGLAQGSAGPASGGSATAGGEAAGGESGATPVQTTRGEVVLPLVPRGTTRLLVLTGPFQVRAEGVKFVPVAAPEAVVCAWAEVDLVRLAATQPALELARQRALVDGTPTSFEVVPPANPWREFLRTPVNVTFRWRLESRLVERSAARFTPLPETEEQLVSRWREQRWRLEEAQPTDIDAPLEAVLTMLTEENNAAFQRVRELQKDPNFFPLLFLRLRELEEALPQAAGDFAGVRPALEKLYRDRAISLDAQRTVARFLATARRRAQNA